MPHYAVLKEKDDAIACGGAAPGEAVVCVSLYVGGEGADM